MDGWNYRAETLYGLSKKRDESLAEQGGVSKRRAGHREGAGKSSFILKPFARWRFVPVSKVREFDSLED